MPVISVFIIILTLFLISVIEFIRKNNNEKKKLPNIYGWSILLLASVLATISFFADDGGISEKGVMAGVMFIGNVTGLIIIVTYLLTREKKNLSTNLVDKLMLLISCLIVGYWYISNDAYHTNITLQLLMITGYVVLINNMYKRKKNTESFIFWSLAFITSVLSFYPSYTTDSSLAIINSWRSTISVLIVLSVMSYYQIKNRKFIR